ncbi:MAG: hypothetical protein CYPHOPRED_002496 [Cyphobasidiales sp. Tagirdzhanova-0007]|nr:MAG: hypothetical protein CYPHOPRED_002496 [Cyphobasidiales sp. Tagirdzhanova-0007]
MTIPALSSSWLGIGLSCIGNILVSVALNTQKLAHERLSQKPSTPTDASTRKASRRERESLLRQPKIYTVNESTYEVTGALKDPIQVIRQLAEAGTEVSYKDPASGRLQKKWLAIRQDDEDLGIAKIMNRQDGQPRHRSLSNIGIHSEARRRTHVEEEETKREKSWYLKSKIWWLGLLLMALGELGNFTSYAFAPASVVAPLGTTALIANCFIAPCMLKERFRSQDLLGIGLSVFGAVVVVISGKSQNKSLSPRELLHAISQLAFIIYSSISLGIIILLMVLSSTFLGSRYLFIDILICALCGGFTVLSTKAFSSFLTRGFFDSFQEWITYPVLAVLGSTALLQIIYLNKALQRFESRLVVPTQFVSFTISAIIGSAILYRDFEDVSASVVVQFLGGCCFVFAGVAILTRSEASVPPSSTSEARDRNATPSSSWAGHDERPEDGHMSPSQSEYSDLALASAGVTLTTQPPSRRASSQSKPAMLSVDNGSVRKKASFGTFPLSSSLEAVPSRPSRTGHALVSAKPFSPGYLLIAGRLGKEAAANVGAEDLERSGQTSTPSSEDDSAEMDDIDIAASENIAQQHTGRP